MKGVKLQHLYHLLATVYLGIILSACGGGGGGGSDNSGGTPVTKVGVFVDSLVAGVSYQTESKSGITNAAGEYDYIEGETVTFSIGDIILGNATAGPVVTPVDIVDGATDASNPVVTNIIRLLVTLDDDGDPSNGLDLTAAATAAVGSTLTVDSPNFETDSTELVEAVKGTGTTLVDATTATNHFNETLHTSWGTSVWGQDCWGALCP